MWYRRSSNIMLNSGAPSSQSAWEHVSQYSSNLVWNVALCIQFHILFFTISSVYCVACSMLVFRTQPYIHFFSNSKAQMLKQDTYFLIFTSVCCQNAVLHPYGGVLWWLQGGWILVCSHSCCLYLLLHTSDPHKGSVSRRHRRLSICMFRDMQVLQQMVAYTGQLITGVFDEPTNQSSGRHMI